MINDGMQSRFNYLILLLALAILFWLELFLLKTFNFWLEMTVATGILALLSLYIRNSMQISADLSDSRRLGIHIMVGIVSAMLLYLIFYLGDFISKRLFDFARTQVNLIYENKSQANPVVIGLLLFFIIGPAEEIFWRGFVQDTLQLKFGDNMGWVIASLIYGGIHVVAWNLMLFMAAMICGFYWGWIYKKYGSLQPCIVSHALWDVTIFVVLPL